MPFWLRIRIEIMCILILRCDSHKITNIHKYLDNKWIQYRELVFIAFRCEIVYDIATKTFEHSQSTVKWNGDVRTVIFECLIFAERLTLDNDPLEFLLDIIKPKICPFFIIKNNGITFLPNSDVL